jgi:SAM-dependent methyltransferase
MPINTIQFKNEIYPEFQSKGNAAKFAIPYATQVCNGVGYDIGCNRPEWSLPNSIIWDVAIDEKQDALNLPKLEVDYIFSSHCLEHLPNWVEAIEHWTSRLKHGGVLFLYLPDYSQLYWRPYHNRKHIHSFTNEMIFDYLRDTQCYKNIFVSGVDLNNSFMVMAEKI